MAEVVRVDFQPKPEPAEDEPRKYRDGDPVPDGYRVFDGGYGHKFLIRDYPYGETTEGRLDALEREAATLRRRVAALERRAGTR